MASKYSINLKYDIQNENVLNFYIPSITHVNVFTSVLDGVIYSSKIKSHLIYGPYGTGKSYVANVLISMLSNANKFRNEEVFKKIISDDVFNNVIDKLDLFSTTNISYLPLVFSGDEGNFSEVFQKKLIDLILTEKLDIDFGYFSIVNRVLETWKNSFPNSYQLFLEALKSEGESEEKFLNDISEHKAKAIVFFEKNYEIITSGAKLNVNYELNVVSLLEKVLSVLKKQNRGLIIVHDEFGRFLQNVNESNIIKNFQIIQDIAEMANNGFSNFSYVIIAHKKISSYLTHLPVNLRPEFDRIEKRFKSHLMTNNSKIFFKLASFFIQKTNGNQLFSDKKALYFQRFINSSNLLKEYSQLELIKDIIEPVFPFNPFVVYYLGQLSSLFGQNERSFVTYFDIVFEPHKTLTISSIHEYFFPSVDYYPEDYFYLKLLKNKLKSNKLLNNSPRHKHLYEFIALWFTMGLGSLQDLNKDLLSFVFGETKNNISEIIRDLLNESLLRQNNLGLLEPFESSGINIKSLIEQTNINFSEYKNTFEDEFFSILGFRTIKAHKYNQQFKMTRFATLSINKDSLGEDLTDIDYLIFIRIIDKNEPFGDLEISNTNFANKISYLNLILDKNSLINEIEEIIKAKIIKNSRKDLLMKQHFPEDLEFFIQERVDSIKSKLKDIIALNLEVFRVYPKVIKKINGFVEFSHFLSQVFHEIYPNTIIINNDQINKKKITTVQKKSIKNLGDSILNLDKNFLNSNGPEVLAFYSVFLDNNYDPFSLMEKGFGNFNYIKQHIYQLLMNEVELSELSDFLINSKYGYALRHPIIPLILAGILRPIWENLVFTGKNLYVQQVDFSFFSEMLFDKFSNFKVKLIKYSINQEIAMKKILNELASYDINKFLPTYNRAFNCVNNWLRSLGQFALQSNELTNEMKRFRELAFQSEFTPLQSFETMGSEKLNIELVIDSFNKFVMEKGEKLLNFIYKSFSVSDYIELKKLINSFDKKVVFSHPISEIIYYSKEKAEIYLNASVIYIEKAFRDISDAILVYLISRIKDSINRILSNDFDEQAILTFSANNKVFAVKRVEYSVSAINLKNRLEGMINALNIRVNQEEIVNILFELIKGKIKGE